MALDVDTMGIWVLHGLSQISYDLSHFGHLLLKFVALESNFFIFFKRTSLESSRFLFRVSRRNFSRSPSRISDIIVSHIKLLRVSIGVLSLKLLSIELKLFLLF